ncbi:DUF3368 domain-containing protein [Chloroflexi bacterium TSY]|nr:DUF3368 domain-containing protein [Chloroflexi bacterium TSY]
MLSALADDVLVPSAVVDEIAAGPIEDRGRNEIVKWPTVVTPTPSPELLAWDLGAGETAVISYALTHPDWTAIIDDGAARQCARSFGVSVKGTHGIIILARQRELILSAAQVLHQLRAVDFRLDDKLIAEVLSKTDSESWP